MSGLKHKVIEDIAIGLELLADNAHVVYAARQLASRIGFDDTQQHLIASAASEMSTNIIRYAGSGTMTLRLIQDDQREGIEIIARDNGPGILNIDEAMQENFSTGGGLGLGLPSVRRIMDEFEIQSRVRQGTCVVARKWR